MKIFPLRPLSQMDKAKNFMRIISGEPLTAESFPKVSDLYVKDAIKETSSLTTEKVARRMTIRNYINKMLKFNKKGE